MWSDNPVLIDFKKAILRLNEVLKLDKSDVIRDSAVKRFEICFDLAWKSIKVAAKHHGTECYSPRECFKTAFQLKMIDSIEVWFEMLNDRNLTAHIYREKYAEDIYSRLVDYSHLFQKLSLQLDKGDD